MFLSYRECVAVPRYGIACCGFAPDDTCLELGMSPNEKFREMLKGPLFPCVTHFNGPNPVSSQSFLESKMSFSFSRIKSKIRARAESNGFHHKRANLKKKRRVLFESLETRRVFAAMFDATLSNHVDHGPLTSNSGSIVWDASTGVLTLNGTANNDTASVTQGNIGSRSFTATLNGTTDSIVLGRQENVSEIIFNGYAGDDSFANNTHYASQAHGGAGDDVLMGGSNRDILNGNRGDDELRGNDGQDLLDGGGGRDTLYGGKNDDVLYGDDGHDNLRGGAGSDQLYGGDSSDHLAGGSGDDRLYGQSGSDTLEGDSGADYIVGGTGNNIMSGGTDADIIVGGDDEDTISGGGGSDIIDGGAGSDTIEGGAGNDSINGGDGNDTIHGNGGDDEIQGGAGADNLYGDGGQDELRGNGGDDGLFGGRDDDMLYGGSGADRFLTQSGDTVHAVNDEDAQLSFKNSSGEVIWRGLNRISWQGGSWTEKEIEVVDEALAALHHRANDTDLLKTSDGDQVSIYRVGSSSDHLIGGWNDGSDVYVTENTMDDDGDGTTADLDDANFIHCLIFHEFGHFWDKEHGNWSDWKDLSGWSWGLFSGWTHDQTSGFARSYGETSPKEDFATVFAKVMQEYLGESYENNATGTDSGLQAKEDHINDFLDNL
jgi:Ca2+-binding RTX toxin-like protein